MSSHIIEPSLVYNYVSIVEKNFLPHSNLKIKNKLVISKLETICLIMLGSFKPSKLSAEFKVILVSLTFYNFSISLILQYVDLFAVALGISPTLLGSFVGIGQFLSAIASLFLGWCADSQGVKKVLIITLILFTCSLGMYGLAFCWLVIIPSIILFYIARNNVIPFADIILIGATEARSRATALSITRLFWALLSSFASIASSIVVAFEGISANGIRPLFVESLFFNVLALFLVARFLRIDRQRSKTRDPIKQKMTGLKVKSFFQDFQEVLKEKNLRRILLMNVIRRISMVMSSPFVYLWMVNVKSADPSILGIVGFLGLIVYALFQLPAGIIADKIGRKKAFILLESFRYIGTIWLIISPTPAQLIVAGILGACGLTSGAESSGIGGASFVPWMVLNWEIVPEEKRGRWHGIISFMSFLNIFVGLCAGVMWEAGLMVQVLILPLILEVCFVLPLLLTTPETHQLAALD